MSVWPGQKTWHGRDNRAWEGMGGQGGQGRGGRAGGGAGQGGEMRVFTLISWSP